MLRPLIELLRRQRRTAHAATGVLVTLVATALLSLTPAIDSLERNVEQRFNFYVRHKVGQAPQLDPRIQIFVWDDQTTALLAKWRAVTVTDVPLVTWARMIEAFSRTRGVFIDKIFENPVGLADASQFVERLTKTGVPLVVGVYAVENPRPMRVALARDRFAPLSRHVADAVHATTSALTSVYGPAAEILPAFRLLGHIMNQDGSRYRPYLSLADGQAVPHWSVTLFGGLSVGADGRPSLGGTTLHLDRDGLAPIDILDRAELAPRIRSVAWLLDRLSAGKPVDGIDENSYVAILPNFFTGNTDFKDTPIGAYEGGFLQASILNSIVTGKTLRPALRREVTVLCTALFGAALAALLSPLWAGLANLIMVAVIAAAGVLAFVYAGVIASWILPGLTLTAAGALTATLRRRAEFVESCVLERDLALGREAQALFLPTARVGRIGPWSFEVIFEPRGALSGDWMQIYAVPEPVNGGPLGVVAVGDVVGKGVSAALNTSIISSIWRRHARLWANGSVDCELMMSEMNDAIHSTFAGRQCTSIALAVLFADHAVTAVRASSSWIKIAPGGSSERLVARARDPLGTDPEYKTQTWVTCDLEPGTSLFACTDGVLDGSRSVSKLRRVLADHPPPCDTGAAFSHIAEAARTAGADDVLPDDATMLLLRLEQEGDSSSASERAA